MENSLRGHAAAAAYSQQHQQQYYSHHSSQRSHHSSHQQQQAQDYMSVGSHRSRGSHASSQQSSVVDEAYRRLGQRLSLRAHGEKPIPRPRRLSQIGLTTKSSFSPYDQKMGAAQRDSSEDPNQDVSTFTWSLVYIEKRSSLCKLPICVTS